MFAAAGRVCRVAALAALVDLLIARAFLAGVPLPWSAAASFVCSRATSALLRTATRADSKGTARVHLLLGAACGLLGFAACPQRPVYVLSVLGSFFASTLTLDLVFDEAGGSSSAAWQRWATAFAAGKDAVVRCAFALQVLVFVSFEQVLPATENIVLFMVSRALGAMHWTLLPLHACAAVWVMAAQPQWTASALCCVLSPTLMALPMGGNRQRAMGAALGAVFLFGALQGSPSLGAMLAARADAVGLVSASTLALAVAGGQ